MTLSRQDLDSGRKREWAPEDGLCASVCWQERQKAWWRTSRWERGRWEVWNSYFLSKIKGSDWGRHNLRQVEEVSADLVIAKWRIDTNLRLKSRPMVSSPSHNQELKLREWGLRSVWPRWLCHLLAVTWWHLLRQISHPL